MKPLGKLALLMQVFVAVMGNDQETTLRPSTVSYEHRTAGNSLPDIEHRSGTSEDVTQVGSVNDNITADSVQTYIPFLKAVSKAVYSAMFENADSPQRFERMDPVELKNTSIDANESIQTIPASPNKTDDSKTVSSGMVVDTESPHVVATDPLAELKKIGIFDDIGKNISDGKTENSTKTVTTEKKVQYRRYPSLQFIAYKAKMEINHQIKYNRLRHATEKRENIEKFLRYKRTPPPPKSGYMNGEIQNMFNKWLKGWF